MIPAMQLRAASIGSAVPRENFDAVIQSVFDSAVNLRLAGEDRLITLLVSDRYELPQGIRIETKNVALQTLTPPTTLRASPNLHAASRGGILRFDSSTLTVDLRGASVWRCPVPDLHADMGSPAVQQAWVRAWERLNQEQRRRKIDIVAGDLFRFGAGPELSRRMSKPVMRLVTAAEQFDPQGAQHAAEKMIGLGPGVTPSGDDILLGFLAGLWSTARGNERESIFLRAFGESLIFLARQTSEISRTYLYHATRGEFSSGLSDLAQAIAKGGQIEEALEEAMRLGHSSGMDSVTGLLIGLCVWHGGNPWQLRNA